MTTPFADSFVPTVPDFRGRIIARITALRERLLHRYRPHFLDHPAVLDQAIEEAESAAWCTPFPHLFLPELAEQQITRRILARASVLNR